jgi:GNAT superfamily N-acetyltransferase
VIRAEGAIVNIGSMWANQDVALAPRRVSNELDTALARADDAFRVHSSVVSPFQPKAGTAIGFGAWRKTYDVFWSMYGGEGIGLYVIPSHRGFGTAVCIIAAICAEIREEGGHFLQTSYAPELAPLYERVGVGRPERACHVSALAFDTLAAAAGRSAREIIRALPDKTLNFVPLDADPDKAG